MENNMPHKEPGSIAPIIKQMLAGLGEDPEREGLLKTPERVEKSLRYLTSGYSENISDIVNGAVFTDDIDEMVIVKQIEFYSMCEHHMLPFYGKAHVAYLPNGKIIGLSKIPRIVDIFARRLQVQERMTAQIAQALQDALNPKGVGVVLEAYHLCMAMRGVEKQASSTTTSKMLGFFRSDERTRAEFLRLIGK